MIRFYVCTIIGSGTGADQFRPALAGVVSGISADDGRADDTQPGGWMIVWVDVTDAQHDTLAATAGVTWIPFETTGGTPLGPGDAIGLIDPTRRSQIRTALENRHIPTDDLTLADPIRKVIARIVRRIRIRRALTNADWFEGLDTLVSAIPNNRRNTIATRLQTAGYDTSVILGTDTIRQALQKVAAQDVRWQRNGWD